MKNILLASNGSGYQIDKCLNVAFFKKSIRIIVSDRSCPVLEVSKKHGIENVNLNEKNLAQLNIKILAIAKDKEIDAVISPGFTRLFTNPLLEDYKNKVFNCHPSILPAFKGFYDTRDVNREIPARKIYERTLDFGSRVTGNTIHIVNETVDDGRPVIQSQMNIPYGEDPDYTRHRLFVQECQTLLQVVSWLNQDRLLFDSENYPYISNASYDKPWFSPNLEDDEIVNFDLSYPWQ